MKKIFLFSVVFLIFIGCNKEKFDSIPHGYFTMEYVNWAWGYQHSGWIIDSDGNVMSFDLPHNWNRVDSLGYISESQLIENISNCDSNIENVSEKKLYKYNKLINGAADGSFSEEKDIGNDCGTIEYYCYLFDDSSELYKKVVLDVGGDFSFHNESKEAKKISRWLKKIK